MFLCRLCGCRLKNYRCYLVSFVILLYKFHDTFLLTIKFTESSYSSFLSWKNLSVFDSFNWWLIVSHFISTSDIKSVLFLLRSTFQTLRSSLLPFLSSFIYPFSFVWNYYILSFLLYNTSKFLIFILCVRIILYSSLPSLPLFLQGSRI